MPQPLQHRFYTFVKQLAATPGMIHISQRIISPVDRFVLWLTGNRYTLSSLLTGATIITLTTTGAKSGQPRTVPLMALEDGDRLILIASNFGQAKHPAWYYNLRAHPEATVTLRGRASVYVAHEASSDEWDRYWAQAIAAYPGYAAYKVRAGERRIPILVMQPKPSSRNQ
jgi:deazaflavin-dependent oxidoreductase (nitroreductase family)